jgi:nitrous oxidase accessory protein
LTDGAYLGPVTIDRTLTLQGGPRAPSTAGPGHRHHHHRPDDVVLTGFMSPARARSTQDIDSGIKILKGADRARIEGNRLTDNMHGIDVHGGRDAGGAQQDHRGRQNRRMNERGNGIYVWNSPGT